MFKKLFLTVAVNLFIGSILFGQSGYSNQKHLNFKLIEPGAFLFEDLGEDVEGQIDLYKDGVAQFSLQLFGINLLTKGNVRFGISAGVGLSKAAAQESNSDALLGVVSTGLVLQFFNGSVNLEAGYMYGHSFKEEKNKTLRNDSALYFGISLPTKLGDLIEL